MSRVAESATQSQLFPSSPVTPPSHFGLSLPSILPPFFLRTLELDRCGTKKSPLPHCRFHLTSRAVESAWRRSHDRGSRTFRAPISLSLDRSTISLDNTFYIRQVGLNFLCLWKHYLLPLKLEHWITHKFTHGLYLPTDLGITLRHQLELVTSET